MNGVAAPQTRARLLRPSFLFRRHCGKWGEVPLWQGYRRSKDKRENEVKTSGVEAREERRERAGKKLIFGTLRSEREMRAPREFARPQLTGNVTSL